MRKQRRQHPVVARDESDLFVRILVNEQTMKRNVAGSTLKKECLDSNVLEDDKNTDYGLLYLASIPNKDEGEPRWDDRRRVGVIQRFHQKLVH